MPMTNTGLELLVTELATKTAISIRVADRYNESLQHIKSVTATAEKLVSLGWTCHLTLIAPPDLEITRDYES